MLRRFFIAGLGLLLISVLLSCIPLSSFGACPIGYGQCPRGYCCPSGDRCANDTRACISPGSVYCGGGRSCPGGTECYANGTRCGSPCTYGRANDGYCLGALGSVYCGGGRNCPAGTECYNNGMNCRRPQTNQTFNQGQGSAGSGVTVGGGGLTVNDVSLACVSMRNQETNVSDATGGGHFWNNWAIPTGAYGCPAEFQLVYQDPKSGQSTWEVCRGCGSFLTTGGPAIPIRANH